jgi:NTP pyrophosphatase (non-canonical NTP hydrolase)
VNRKEHLLTILIEECQELAKDAAKALRFGTLDRKTMDPTKVNTDPDEPTNADRMEKEFNDIVAIVYMLRDEYPDEFNMQESALDQLEKKRKVEKYLEYSAMVGTLDQEPPHGG